MSPARAASHRSSTLYGWLVSPYTAKVRAMLAYKRVPFTETHPSVAQMFTTVKPNVGRTIMPAIKLADGSWRQDSALICDEIEAAHPEHPTQPAGGAQRLASSLLELHGDEWLPILALHYRWDVPANARWAVGEFGANAFPWLPGFVSNKLASPFAAKMQSFRKVQLGTADRSRIASRNRPRHAARGSCAWQVQGIGPETVEGVERFATRLIAQLEAHLSQHEFILGGAPCRGDFSLCVGTCLM